MTLPLQPLQRLKVLDLSQIMAGPYCSMLLGDMGADVIKIEPPGVGDQTRRAMGFRLKGEDSGGFLALNRNKRSVELNLKNDNGREAFYELVRNADIVVENYRPGVAKRLMIDYATLKTINPKIVYASISGFGQTGPWSARPGLDLIAQAMSGVMSATGYPDLAPVKCSVPIADLGSGLLALYAILSAVIGREHTGEGQYIDASLFETSLGLSIWETSEFWGTGKVPTPIGSANRMSAPYQAVRSSNGYLVIGAANQKLWTSLCSVIGRQDLVEDACFTTNGDRLRNRVALIEEIEKQFVTRTSEDWTEALLAAGVPAAPIYNYEQALASEQSQARNMVMDIEHPVEGTIKSLGFPVKMSGTPQQVRHPPPLLGQHTDEVLLEFGFNQARLNALRAGGAFDR